MDRCIAKCSARINIFSICTKLTLRDTNVKAGVLIVLLCIIRCLLTTVNILGVVLCVYTKAFFVLIYDAWCTMMLRSCGMVSAASS